MPHVSLQSVDELNSLFFYFTVKGISSPCQPHDKVCGTIHGGNSDDEDMRLVNGDMAAGGGGVALAAATPPQLSDGWWPGATHNAPRGQTVNSTPTNTARSGLHSIVTFHHANTRGSRAAKLWIAHLLCPRNNCHPRVMSRPLPHLTLTTSTSSHSPISSTSPIFPTVSLLHTSPMILDPCIPCDVPRQSGGSIQIPSLTSYEPKSVENKAFDTEAIEPEDLEPRRIELDKNLGTDPHQRQERFKRNSITEEKDEF